MQQMSRTTQKKRLTNARKLKNVLKSNETGEVPLLKQVATVLLAICRCHLVNNVEYVEYKWVIKRQSNVANNARYHYNTTLDYIYTIFFTIITYMTTATQSHDASAQ